MDGLAGAVSGAVEYANAGDAAGAIGLNTGLADEDAWQGRAAEHSFMAYGDESGDGGSRSKQTLGAGNVADEDDLDLRDTLGHLNESKPTLAQRSQVGFTRAAGSNPFKSGPAVQATRSRDVAPIDLSKVTQQTPSSN